MKKVGAVIHYTRNGNLVTTTNQMVREGTPVYLRGKKLLGTVIETFGPVTEPYLLIKPIKLDAKPNEDVYIEEM